MQQLVNHDAECPNISLRPVNTVDKPLRRHIQRRPYRQVPKLLPTSFISYLANSAKPKSAILALPLWRKILATFKSLCTTPTSARYISPSKTSLIKGAAFSSVRKPSLFTNMSKSPPLQTSVTMQHCRSSLIIWWHLSTCGWLIFMRTSIYVRCNYSNLCVRSDQSSTTFTATAYPEWMRKVPVVQFRPEQTFEKFPAPSSREGLKEQLPMRRSTPPAYGLVDTFIKYTATGRKQAHYLREEIRHTAHCNSPTAYMPHLDSNYTYSPFPTPYSPPLTLFRPTFINNKMSHLRDIQRLRQTRNNLDPLTLPLRLPQRPVDIYNINFDRLQPDPRPSHPHSKESLSTSTASRDRRASHNRRGSSNATNQPESPSLSIYNFSMRPGQKATSSTARREKPLASHDFQPLQMNGRTRWNSEVGVANFELLCPVGKGGFGKVWKVEVKKTRQILAMKEMYKAKIIAKKSINSVMNQRTLLARLRHPFLINICHAFQDRENLYLTMDYVNGGDLRYHIGRRRRFTEPQTKFFIANLIVGLEYLHRNRIIHRDIKPQNLVLDNQGYVRITDLGVSRQWKEENYQDTSGTPGYMSPEVMCRKNHSFPADYFAVGVIAYEFMLGRRPYVGKNRKEIRDQVLSRQAAVKLEELPNRWSLDAVHFINQLLQRNPNARLGAGRIQQLKRHDWMKGVDFAKLQKKQIKAPYLPVSIQENYQDYKEQISEDSVEDNAEENMLMLRDEQVQSLFEGYEYDPSRIETNSARTETRKNSSSQLV